MQRYRDNADLTLPPLRADSGQDSGAPTADMEMDDIRLDYGLDVSMAVGQPPSHEELMTVQQEYKTYITQTSPAGTDILKFWEVRKTWRTGGAYNIQRSLTGLPRSTNTLSRLSLR